MGLRSSQTRCSFCGAPRDASRRMVAGPGVFICADCVRLSCQILGLDASAGAGPEPQLAARRLVPFERAKGLLRRFRVRRVAWSGWLPQLSSRRLRQTELMHQR